MTDDEYIEKCWYGWKDLIKAAKERLASEGITNVSWKEKYGRLCIETDNLESKETLDFINDLEDQSENTCIECGEPGRIVEIGDWVYTVCPDCEAKIREKQYNDSCEESSDNQNKKLYRVTMPDCCVPAWISATINYYGTEEAIKEVVKCIGRDDLESVTEKYFKEGTVETVILSFIEVEQFIKPVEFISSKDFEFKNIKMNFKNIWGCDDIVNISKVNGCFIYFKDTDNIIKRAIKVTAEHVILGENKNKKIHDISLSDEEQFCAWGLSGMIKVAGKDSITNTLYYVDTIFESLDDLKKDFEDPKKPDLNRFMLEIFGDG